MVQTMMKSLEAAWSKLEELKANKQEREAIKKLLM